MSTKSCQAFLRMVCDSPEVKRQLRVVTAPQEMVRLGLRHGYVFDINELVETSSSFNGDPGAATTGLPSQSATPTTFYHQEYKLADIRGFEAVLDELPKLKIKPRSVDLARFNLNFREEDLLTTSMSPADPGFRSWHDDMMKAHWRDPNLGQGAPRRDFHLINLDEHIEHPDYDRYFEAKVRTAAVLEELFGDEVQFSGSLWYPPSSYRLWHTNETQPGWRMYIVDLDDEFTSPDRTSFFRYMNPETEEIVTLRESRQIVRFFKVNQDPNRLFWHCIVNPTIRHRWSFGFGVPENWMESIQTAALTSPR